MPVDWMEDVKARHERGNQVLFAKDSAFFGELNRLIAQQNHRTMALWAFECAGEAVDTLLVRYPDELRPATAVIKAKAWAAGEAKMPEAQRAILEAHAVAKEIDSPEDIALCHAVGHACAVVHTASHAIGFPVYELTAIVRRHGIADCRGPAEARMQWYLQRIGYWRDNHSALPSPWAGFMMRD